MKYYTFYTIKDASVNTSMFYEIDSGTGVYSPSSAIRHLTCKECNKYEERKAFDLLATRSFQITPKHDHFVTFDGWRVVSNKFKEIVDRVAPKLVSWYPIGEKKLNLFFGSIQYLAKCKDETLLTRSNLCSLCGRYENILEGDAPMDFTDHPEIIGLPFENRFCSSPRWLVSERIKEYLEATNISNIEFHQYMM
ncbi:hypothetical protein KIH39_21205 [Telmatocola sphagniphila]|uniref:Uncharacterized protein n=1 Tax=Telmatocola sphagniphila TaxID=1123043 RepID=A0A8E6B6K0_9BACT|nr:hypothetical protein [Telmatocola sphagniphila]QVL31340.1 hypothetical protein KIH39_21205 [Telmatocola sphagniphila]